MLKRMKIANPMQQQKDEAEKRQLKNTTQSSFILGANKYKYGKLIKEMKNDVICKKDPFRRQLVKQVTYYPNGQITIVENITMEKVTQMMVWPLQW